MLNPKKYSTKEVEMFILIPLKSSNSTLGLTQYDFWDYKKNNLNVNIFSIPLELQFERLIEKIV